MAKKDDLKLRPVMTRIPEGLRRRLEREAKWRRSSMNAEIVKRLQESFDIPDQAEAIAADIESELYGVSERLDEIKTQNRAILSHLGLPDPVEQAARESAQKRAARQGNKDELDKALKTIERTFGRGSIMKMPSETEGSEPKDGEKK